MMSEPTLSDLPFKCKVCGKIVGEKHPRVHRDIQVCSPSCESELQIIETMISCNIEKSKYCNCNPPEIEIYGDTCSLCGKMLRVDKENEWTVADEFDSLKEMNIRKSKEYGNQGELLDDLMKKIFEHLDLEIDSNSAGDLHFSMELIAKTLRYFNIRFAKGGCKDFKDCIDSLEDNAVYSVMLATKYKNT